MGGGEGAGEGAGGGRMIAWVLHHFSVWRQGEKELRSALCSFMEEIHRETADDDDKETANAGFSGVSGTIVGI